MNADKSPIAKPAPGLRQRWRARSNDWRIWWEPSAAQRALGLKPVELDGERLTWSNRKAAELTRQADRLGGKVKTAPSKTARKVAAARNSIDAVCGLYLDPKNWRFHKNSEIHKSNVRYDISRILDKWSGTAVRGLTAPVIDTWYESLLAQLGPRGAERLIRSLSVVLSYAVVKGFIDHNPALNMRLESAPARDRIVSWSEYAALEHAADQLGLPSLRLTMALSMFMGQRVTDCIENTTAGSFILHQINDQKTLCWRLTRSKDRKHKTSNLIVHPDVEPLIVAALQRLRPDDWPRRTIAPDARLVIQDTNGRPMNIKRHQKLFANIRLLASKSQPSLIGATSGLKPVQFRDLRRTFSDNARHAGIVSDDVDDALGNTAGTDASLRQVYMPGSDRLAASAILAVQRPEDKKRRA